MSRRRQPHQKRPKGSSPWRRRPRQSVRRTRRKKGDKSKNAKMANVGVIYTLRVTGGVVEGPIHKRVYATFRPLEQLMIWLRAEANQRGYGRTRTIFIAVGGVRRAAAADVAGAGRGAQVSRVSFPYRSRPARRNPLDTRKGSEKSSEPLVFLGGAEGDRTLGL
jgi:hypothetical protein